MWRLRSVVRCEGRSQHERFYYYPIRRVPCDRNIAKKDQANLVISYAPRLRVCAATWSPRLASYRLVINDRDAAQRQKIDADGSRNMVILPISSIELVEHFEHWEMA